MKYLLLLLLLPLFGSTQKIVLLDRQFRNPVTLTDSISPEQFPGTFPVYLNQFDSLIKVADHYRQSFNRGRGEKHGPGTFYLGSTKFVSGNKENAYTGNQVLIATRVGFVQTSLELVGPADSNRRAQQKLAVFIDYLRNNRPLLAPEPARAP